MRIAIGKVSSHIFGLTTEDFEYKQTSNSLVGTYSHSDSKIKVFTRTHEQSSTFEYDLILKIRIAQN